MASIKGQRKDHLTRKRIKAFAELLEDHRPQPPVFYAKKEFYHKPCRKSLVDTGEKTPQGRIFWCVYCHRNILVEERDIIYLALAARRRINDGNGDESHNQALS